MATRHPYSMESMLYCPCSELRPGRSMILIRSSNASQPHDHYNTMTSGISSFPFDNTEDEHLESREVTVWSTCSPPANCVGTPLSDFSRPEMLLLSGVEDNPTDNAFDGLRSRICPGIASGFIPAPWHAVTKSQRRGTHSRDEQTVITVRVDVKSGRHNIAD
eukprot:gene22223-biopygen14751